MKDIKFLVLDVDGTLTDGKIYVDDKDNSFKAFNVKDGFALVNWLKLGGEVAILTGKKSNIVERRAKELGIKYIIQGSKNKKQDLKKYRPEFMAIEDLFYFKNNKTVISVAQARGVILLAGKQNNIAMSSYTPLQVKIGITGYGKAEKKQVQQMVQKFLGLSEIPKPDDAADALAICITHINSLGSKLSFSGTNNLKKIVVPSGTNKISLEEYKNLLKK